MSAATATPQSPKPVAPSGEAPILEVKGLGVEFLVEGNWATASTGLDFAVHPGEVLAIVGESGSGKSTAAMALLSLLPSNSRVNGSAKLQGEELIGAPVSKLRSIRGGRIAVIFQEPMTALNPVYTIGFQIIEAIQEHSRLTKAEAKVEAIKLLEMVELPDPQKAFDSFPHQLSGGQRQRAMIAQSIACDPVLLIADEPTTALDVTVQAEILDLLRNLKDRLNSAIILITHDMGVVADMADNIIVMKDGVAVEYGSVEKVYSAPEHPYTQRLLAAVPHLGIGEATVVSEKARTASPVLRAEKLVIEYPKRGRVPAFRAVDEIDLEIYPGEVLGLVGESGSGKTTVGRALVGLLPVAGGTLELSGTSMAGLKERDLRPIRRDLGIVFQDPGSSLNPRWPVGQSIGEPLLLSGQFSKDEIEKRVSELLDQVEIPRAYRNRYPHELSGGQRQRIGIARAIALKPKLLIADEPTSALDVSVQARVLELFEQLQAELGFACLFVTHDLAVVDQLADRIAVMNRGRIVEQGPTEQILRNPQHGYTQKLISAVPLPDPVIQRARREERQSRKQPKA